MIKLANNHFSVDCVVFGFDGGNLRVLLLHRRDDVDDNQFHDMKLPGSLIYEDEDLDKAALRVLNELTGLTTVDMIQFKTYGSKNRTRDPRDVLWLERAQNAHVERIVTVAYLALVKISRPLKNDLYRYDAEWIDVDNIPDLAFDHNVIVNEALERVRLELSRDHGKLFKLLPRKFTALQLRTLFEVMQKQSLDARNFHKRLKTMPYIVPLDERQAGVAHRAARYYKFDKKLYEKK